MKRKPAKQLVVTCPNCGHANVFKQPYKYHAGFNGTVFLYNEAGNCTLTWSSYDRDFRALVGDEDPWALSLESQHKVEYALKPSSQGGRWLFSNPARCLKCSHPISRSITSDIYFLKYDGSVDLDPSEPTGPRLKSAMK